MRTRSLLAPLVIATLALAACGDDDDDDGGDVSEAEQPYVAALEQAMTSGEEADDLVLTEAQGDCVAPRWIRTITVEKIEAAGLTAEDIGAQGDSDLSELGLTEEQGNALYDSFGDCDVDVHQLFVESMAADGGMSDEAADCLAGAFDDDLLRRVMVTSLVAGDEGVQNDQELTSALMAALSECPEAVTGS